MAAALALAGGCEGGPQAGVRGTDEAWTAATETQALAGSLDAPSELSFHQMASAVRMSGGEIVVLDGGLRSRLTVLTPEGGFLGTIGRNGEGPGEFGWVTSIQAGGSDTLFVFDAGQQRLTVFSLDGSVLRTASYRPVGGEMLGSVTRLAGERWLGRGLDSPQQGPTYRIVRDTVVLGLLGPDLGQLELLASLPSLMSTSTPIGGRMGFGAAAFTPVALHATWGHCVFVSTADTSSIRVFSADGGLVRSFEGPGTRRLVTGEQLDAYAQNRLRRVPASQRPLVIEALRDAAHPESLPFYHQMLVDPWGYLWLQEYAPPTGLGDHWYVLTQSGRIAADLVLVRGLRVYAIDEHGLLGVTVGDFDEETIVTLPMISRPLEGAEPIDECRPGTA